MCFVVDSVTIMIAGYLILEYSKDDRSNLRKDPITEMDVPSLIFVYN